MYKVIREFNSPSFGNLRVGDIIRDINPEIAKQMADYGFIEKEQEEKPLAVEKETKPAKKADK